MIVAFAILIFNGAIVALMLANAFRLRREERSYREYRDRLSGVSSIHEIARRKEHEWLRAKLAAAAGGKRRKAKA